MELAISAIASDLVSRFISFVITKLSSRSPCSEPEGKTIQRLHHLLLRVQTVVEEADARHITNSGMLMQLKILEDALYRGYYALDTFRYRRLLNDDIGGTVSDGTSSSSSALYFATPLKRLRRSAGGMNQNHRSVSNEVRGALGNLEAAVANMTEFVVLLGGCERVLRRPYDTYIYMENFMFGRCAEKQQVANFLLDNSLPAQSPAVLPVIGGRLVGKKTLVAHVCNDERIRSRFSSVLHINGDNFQNNIHPEMCMPGRTLAVVEFTSDVRDEDWVKFHSLVKASMTDGSKVIVISRFEKVARFGTVKPVIVHNLTFEEYSYLFKVLSFGSSSMDDHPQLASMAHEFPALLRGSLVSASALADVLRKNMDVQFWTSVLTKCRNVVENNLSVFGEHPKLLLERDRPTDITKFVSASSGVPLRLMPPRDEADVAERSLPMVTFGDLLTDPGVLPKGDFDLVTWESKIAPYAKYIHFVPAYAEEKSDTIKSARRKRAALFL